MSDLAELRRKFRDSYKTGVAIEYVTALEAKVERLEAAYDDVVDLLWRERDARKDRAFLDASAADVEAVLAAEDGDPQYEKWLRGFVDDEVEHD
jgi:hypothetical protein